MKYKLKLEYVPEGPHGGTLNSIESPIFDFPNPIIPGQNFIIFGKKYSLYRGDNGTHFVDENGAYTIIDLSIHDYDLYSPNWKPNDPQSKKHLENILESIKQDFAKLKK